MWVVTLANGMLPCFSFYCCEKRAWPEATWERVYFRYSLPPIIEEVRAGTLGRSHGVLLLIGLNLVACSSWFHMKPKREDLPRIALHSHINHQSK